MADRHVEHLLIGGGVAAAYCAAALREEGAEGSVLLVGREQDPPYDRPPCSKEYLQGRVSREETYVHPADWYAEQGIELLTRTSVMKLDAAARTAKLSSKEEVSFDHALLATGANVRRLNVDGCDLDGIHYLRALGNADTIRADAEECDYVVLIGGSYIGCEVAASLTLLGKRCAIVMMEPVVLARQFGETAGRFLQDRLQEHGIEVFGSDELLRFEGEGRVARVVTKAGRELPAHMVVVGAGAVPDVMLARAAGLELGETGGVRADRFLRTSAEGVYAAGDLVEYDSVVHGRRLRVEHWDVALNQGRTAALNMLGREQPYDVVPYFFSDLADWVSLEYVGPALDGWDQEIVRGSLEEHAFSMWHLRDGRVAATLSIGRSEDLEHARRLIASGADVSARVAELADVNTDLASLP
ncbi:MAG: FAD-dependent pyridine nucleotide-disulfide oxidoreductase [Solirubrobacterales bacterium]|nr:FAD-dependent pyridine nucleotide-disulfide oxidoreductase [Solirubrobacterales bacterium]